MIRQFQILPEAVKSQLEALARSRGAQRDAYVVSLAGWGGPLAPVIFGGGAVLVVLLIAVNGGLWDSTSAAWAAAFNVAGAVLALHGIDRVRAYKRSRVRPAIIATPLLIARVGLDRDAVAFHYLRDASSAPSITHRYQNGAYQGTDFKLRFRAGKIDRTSDGIMRFEFTTRRKADADGILEFLQSTTHRLRKWQEAGVLDEKIGELDWISLAKADREEGEPEEPSAGRNRKLGKLGLGAVVALAFTGVLYGVNWLMNEERAWVAAKTADTPEAYVRYVLTAPLKWKKEEAEKRRDDRAFELAVRSNRAAPLRQYQKDLPGGAHVKEARAAIVKLYQTAEEKYRASPQFARADAQAAEGIVALLARLSEDTDRPVVGIEFLPAEGIDERIVDRVKQATHAASVAPVGPSFSPEQNRRREARIIGTMHASFGTVFPEDLFELHAEKLNVARPRFLVRTRIAASGSYYTQEKEANLPLEQKHIFVGIAFRFEIALQVPGSKHPPSDDPGEGYCFSVDAKPAPNFSVRDEPKTSTVPGFDPEAMEAVLAQANGQPRPDPNARYAGTVYDRMADTAFEKFGVELTNAYGLELAMPANWGKLAGR